MGGEWPFQQDALIQRRAVRQGDVAAHRHDHAPAAIGVKDDGVGGGAGRHCDSGGGGTVAHSTAEAHRAHPAPRTSPASRAQPPGAMGTAGQRETRRLGTIASRQDAVVVAKMRLPSLKDVRARCGSGPGE